MLQRGKVVQTGGGGSWVDLGDMSAGCMAIPDTCKSGGTLMVWIKRLENKVGGILSSVYGTRTSTGYSLSAGIDMLPNYPGEYVTIHLS